MNKYNDVYDLFHRYTSYHFEIIIDHFHIQRATGVYKQKKPVCTLHTHESYLRYSLNLLNTVKPPQYA